MDSAATQHPQAGHTSLQTCPHPSLGDKRSVPYPSADSTPELCHFLTVWKTSQILLDLSEQTLPLEVGSSAWRRERLQGNHVVAFQYLKGTYKKERDNLFSKTCGDRTRSNGFKLREGTFRLDIRKKLVTTRVVNKLPRVVVEASSLETFKVRLSGALNSPV